MMNLRLKLPQIYMPEQIWKKMFAYIMACPSEIGGIGSVERVEEDFIVTDVFLLEQKSTMSRMTLDRQAVQRFIVDWVMQKRDTSVLHFWWHSHSDGAVFWSSIDDGTIQALAAKDSLTNQGYVVSMVANRLGCLRARITATHPVPFDIDDVPIVVMPDLESDSDLRRMAEAEVAEKVHAGTRYEEIADEWSAIGEGLLGGVIDGLGAMHPSARNRDLMRRRHDDMQKKREVAEQSPVETIDDPQEEGDE